MENILHGSAAFPFMSDSTADLFVSTILEDDYDVVVEYGSGGSTIYYLEHLLAARYTGTFVSVEFDSNWYEEVVTRVRQTFSSTGLDNEVMNRLPWSDAKIDRYLSLDRDHAQPRWDHPESLRRLEAHGRSVLRSQLGGASGVPGCPKFLFTPARPSDAVYHATIGSSLSFLYLLKHEFFKDQYGESPIKHEYISAGLRWPVEERLKSESRILRAAFIIDGGPRGEIVDAILDLENTYAHFLPTIFLLEGSRCNFHSATHRRVTGRFVAGSNNTPLTQLPVYENETPPALFNEVDNLVIFGKADMSWQEKAARELWFYKRELPRQGVAPHNQVLLDAAAILFEQQDFSRAADHLQALCDREPQQSWLQLHLAEALLRSHRPLPRSLLNTLRTQFSHSRRFQALERAATQRA